MSNTNKARAEQLGMPYGTASGRLRKMLMFKFAQELGYDVCFKCEGKIDTVQELSIEHKEPWFDRPNGVEKFWDLDNIAFSHLSCNTRDRNGSIKQRRVGPEGTVWCHHCKEFKPEERFWKNKSRWNGYYLQCKECYEKRYRKR